MKRSEGYEPGFDLNVEEGAEGEDLVENVLGMEHAAVEVKRKSYRDFQFYVEVSHSPPGCDYYKPSGINVTESKFWVYTIESTGIMVVIPVDRLRLAARMGAPKEETDGDNPTKGRLVGSAELFPVYETHVLEEVCGKCGGDVEVGPGRAISDGVFRFLCRPCWWGIATGKDQLRREGQSGTEPITATGHATTDDNGSQSRAEVET